MPEVKNVKVKEITKVKDEEGPIPMFPIKKSRWSYPDGAIRIKQWIEERDYKAALSEGIRIEVI